MQTETANILGLDTHDATAYAPRHEVRDEDHMQQLAASMAANGWVGAPIVADTETAQAITGSHRIAAAQKVGIAIPAVDIFDLAEAADIDLYDLIDEHGSLEDALPALCDLLPADIRDAYGMDIH